MLIDINAERAKSLVWSMKNYLAQAGYDVPNTALLEALSQGIGCTNYRTLKAASASKQEPIMASAVPGMARHLMKGDTSVPVRFDMHFLADGGSIESALMYFTVSDLEALLEARHQVLRAGVESIAVKPPEMLYEGDGSMTLEPSMLKVTRSGIDFSVVMFYRGHHRSAQVKTWTLSALVDDLNLRTPGTVVDANMSQEPDDEESTEADDDSVESNRAEGHEIGLGQKFQPSVHLMERFRHIPLSEVTVELKGEVREKQVEGTPASTGTKLMPTRHLAVPLELQLEWWQDRHLAEALAEGWAVFDTAGVGCPPDLSLQRDDETGIFEGDLDAWAHILKRADEDMNSAAFGALQLMTPRYEVEMRRDVQEAKRTGALK